MIEYKKINLFDSPVNSYILHAVNCQGVWGSGIAAQFAKLYPEAYKGYKSDCGGYERTGDYGVYFRNDEPHHVLWIYTSFGFGRNRDSVETILDNTRSAIKTLIMEFPYGFAYTDECVIYSNKFNSGLFGVPWHETEAILLECLTNHNPNNVKWIVCDPDMKLM